MALSCVLNRHSLPTPIRYLWNLGLRSTLFNVLHRYFNMKNCFGCVSQFVFRYFIVFISNLPSHLDVIPVQNFGRDIPIPFGIMSLSAIHIFYYFQIYVQSSILIWLCLKSQCPQIPPIFTSLAWTDLKSVLLSNQYPTHMSTTLRHRPLSWLRTIRLGPIWPPSYMPQSARR